MYNINPSNKYYNKYLKYKQKYLELKGGAKESVIRAAINTGLGMDYEDLKYMSDHDIIELVSLNRDAFDIELERLQEQEILQVQEKTIHKIHIDAAINTGLEMNYEDLDSMSNHDIIELVHDKKNLIRK